VLPAPAVAKGATVSVFDPIGETSLLLKRLGYSVTQWTKGQPISSVAVVGAKALSNRHLIPGNIDTFVRNGGRLIVFNQDNDWTRLSLQFRTAPYVARRVFPVRPSHPVLQGLNADNLRDWNGAGTVVTAYPHYPGLEALGTYGWHWGNKGSVSSTPIEKPHRSSWRPILETEFDLAYTPLMEMEYGKGRVTFCTLDLASRTEADPAADRLAAQLMAHVRTAPLTPKAAKVIYVGDDTGAKMLDDLGVVYSRAQKLDRSAQLTIVGNAAQLGGMDDYLRQGGRALFLARAPGAVGSAGLSVETRPTFQGSQSVPGWKETAGLSISDLHWKTIHEGRVLVGGKESGVEIGADGLIARRKVGKGFAVYTQ
jgi:beta-galactosidase